MKPFGSAEAQAFDVLIVGSGLAGTDRWRPLHVGA